jgi:mannose-6-phosphate isomerase-like protein (cupin superfamily)
MIHRVDPVDLGPKPWGTETLIAKTDHYIGKVLRMKAGHRGGLQYHVHKDETFFLYEGVALVTADDGSGALITRTMLAGDSYHIPPGAVHQVEAVNDCVFFETSTPHFEDRVNVAAQYDHRLDTGESW